MSAGFNATDARHIDIHKDKVRVVIGDKVESFVPVLGF
jgi:hypothetical protein